MFARQAVHHLKKMCSNALCKQFKSGTVQSIAAAMDCSQLAEITEGMVVGSHCHLSAVQQAVRQHRQYQFMLTWSKAISDAGLGA